MILSIENLSFSYPRRPVLKGFTFAAESGQCVCLLGENGAGKTTLFRCLTGGLRGHTGRILLDGAPLGGLSVRELSRRLAYIPQASAPAFNYSVLDTVLMGLNPHLRRLGSPGRREEGVALQALERVGIEHLAASGLAQISGGERQLALIARALAQKSPLLLMDEPTANLDYARQHSIMGLMRALAREGYLVLLSTHNPEHALLYGTHALVLRDGVAAAYGPPAATLTEEVLSDLYSMPIALRHVQTPGGDMPVCLPYDSDQHSTE